MHDCVICKRFSLLLVAVVLLVGVDVQNAFGDSGIIVFNTVRMKDKINSSWVTSGYADANLAVEFDGDAYCQCHPHEEDPVLQYTRYFGDGTSANGKNVTHT